MDLVDITLLISMVLCWGHTALKEDQIQKLLPWLAVSYSSSSSSFFLHVFVPVDRYYFAVQRKS